MRARRLWSLSRTGIAVIGLVTVGSLPGEADPGVAAPAGRSAPPSVRAAPAATMTERDAIEHARAVARRRFATSGRGEAEVLTTTVGYLSARHRGLMGDPWRRFPPEDTVFVVVLHGREGEFAAMGPPGLGRRIQGRDTLVAFIHERREFGGNVLGDGLDASMGVDRLLRPGSR